MHPTQRRLIFFSGGSNDQNTSSRRQIVESNLKMRVERRRHAPGAAFTAVGRLEAEYCDDVAAFDVVICHRWFDVLMHWRRFIHRPSNDSE